MLARLAGVLLGALIGAFIVVLARDYLALLAACTWRKRRAVQAPKPALPLSQAAKDAHLNQASDRNTRLIEAALREARRITGREPVWTGTKDGHVRVTVDDVTLEATQGNNLLYVVCPRCREAGCDGKGVQPRCPPVRSLADIGEALDRMERAHAVVDRMLAHPPNCYSAVSKKP